MITRIGSEELAEEARRADCRLELVPALGEFVPAGGPLFRVHGEARDLDEERLHDALILALEPTLDEDVAYGLRLLVDIAERSLADSPLQDSTTAVQAIDRLHDLCDSSRGGRSRTDGTTTMQDMRGLRSSR